MVETAEKATGKHGNAGTEMGTETTKNLDNVSQSHDHPLAKSTLGTFFNP